MLSSPNTSALPTPVAPAQVVDAGRIRTGAGFKILPPPVAPSETADAGRIPSPDWRPPTASPDRPRDGRVAAMTLAATWLRRILGTRMDTRRIAAELETPRARAGDGEVRVIARQLSAWLGDTRGCSPLAAMVRVDASSGSGS